MLALALALAAAASSSKQQAYMALLPGLYGSFVGVFGRGTALFTPFQHVTPQHGEREHVAHE
jgi:hypothetical protein